MSLVLGLVIAIGGAAIGAAFTYLSFVLPERRRYNEAFKGWIEAVTTLGEQSKLVRDQKKLIDLLRGR